MSPYLKGYHIIDNTKRIYTLKKADFAGDRSYTYASFMSMLDAIRNTPPHAYPIQITDLDQIFEEPISILTPNEFELWMKNKYSK